MALIACRECGRKISDQAPACPGCGAPVLADKVVTTQQTGKEWKGMQAMGVIMIIAGMVGCIMDFNSNADPTSSAGLSGVGLLMYTVGRFFTWWDHG